MVKDREVPYVAAGFRVDAAALLEKFMESKTLEFKTFAEMCTEMNMPLIFLGRGSLREMCEFILECYRTVWLFLDSTDIYQKVGSVYLLYFLYFKQPFELMKRRINIPITPKQLYILEQLESYIVEYERGQYDADIIFIINKLFKIEAFDFCYCAIPMGPTIPFSLLKQEPLRHSQFKEVLSSLKMVRENEVQKVVDLSKTYEAVKKKLPCVSQGIASSSDWSKKLSELEEGINRLDSSYKAGLLPNTGFGDEDTKLSKDFKNLGQRRAMLKTMQFEKLADAGQSRKTKSTSELSSEPSPPTTPVKRGRGRPRKIKTGKRGRKKRTVRPKVIEDKKPGFFGESDDDAEAVDNPKLDVAPVRRRRNPRPLRKHYFDDF